MDPQISVMEILFGGGAEIWVGTFCVPSLLSVFEDKEDFGVYGEHHGPAVSVGA